MKKNAAIVVLSIALVLVVGVGGVLAYLQDKTDTITNTFTFGLVDIDLTETTGNQYKLIPGSTLSKDPTITVKKGSEACYVYVKIEDNATDFITWEIAEGWTKLTGVDGVNNVWYRTQDGLLDPEDENVTISVLKDNEVTVNESIGTSGTPTLAFTAYACQQAEFNSAAAAWTGANFT